MKIRARWDGEKWRVVGAVEDDWDREEAAIQELVDHIVSSEYLGPLSPDAARIANAIRPPLRY